MPSVFILDHDYSFIDMFVDEGWTVADNLKDADLVQFTGGEDVYPRLYGQPDHPLTYSNPNRDNQEMAVFRKAFLLGKRMAGVCRGGQFLNVMSGGAMYQHVNEHGLYGTHLVYDKWTGETFEATSTHHQMMKPSNKGLLIATGGNLATTKQFCSAEGLIVEDSPLTEEDCEVVYYPHTQALCFQPHPEYNNGLICRVKYFEYINRYLFNEG